MNTYFIHSIVHVEVYKPQNKAESCWEEKKQLNERKVAELSSSNMDVQELEEKLKQLQEEFSLPKVLLKKTLCGDDVNGDLVKARQRLQESKQIDNPSLKRTSPMANESVTENPKRGRKDSSLRQWKPNNSGPGLVKIAVLVQSNKWHCSFSFFH